MRSKEQLKRIKRGHDCLDCCSTQEWDRTAKKWIKSFIPLIKKDTTPITNKLKKGITND